MKQKTATFALYTPFGTAMHNIALNIYYRRNCLYSFSGQDQNELIAKATKYAQTLGFNAFKVEDIRG